MGIVRTDHETERVEWEEFKRMLLSSAGTRRRKGGEDIGNNRTAAADVGGEQKLVCVTSGLSFLGIALVKRLLVRGYSVRVIVHSEEDKEKLREMGNGGSSNVEGVMARETEVESLMEAFNGCRGVFHTSAFTDPAGLSGYSKCMADLEVKASESVLEACARTPSVRNCVFTSSLLACVWRDNSQTDLPSVVNHDSWSDESVCLDKKLWYALGKLRAEKAAWRIANESRLNLTTICPGLITGPEFICRSPTPAIAYLKGAPEIYRDGLLATIDVNRLAEAHVCVFEEMGKTASGRYLCFDTVIQREDDAERLTQEMGLPKNKIIGEASSNPKRFELSNNKLSRLMPRTTRCRFEDFGLPR